MVWLFISVIACLLALAAEGRVSPEQTAGLLMIFGVVLAIRLALRVIMRAILAFVALYLAGLVLLLCALWIMVRILIDTVR